MWKFSSDKKFAAGTAQHPSGRVLSGQFCAILACTLFLAMLSCWELSPINSFEHLIQDALIRFRAGQFQDSSVQYTAIVDVDDDTLRAAGQWPWPRYRTAHLIKTLASPHLYPNEAAPAAIALDILFSEPDRTSLTTIQTSFQRDFGLDISFQGVPSGMEDNDTYLGSILGSAGAVSACFMYFDMENTEAQEFLPQALQVTGSIHAISPPVAHGILVNTEAVQQNVRFSGFINALLDEDGILRSLPLLISYKGKWFPSLCLAAVMRAQQVTTIHIEKDWFGPVIVAGQARFPVDETGCAVIGFTGKQRTIPTISALDVLTGCMDKTLLKERIVFLGTSATVLQDLYQTPVGAGYPGVETHAVIAENSLTNTSLRVPVWQKRYTVGIIFLSGIAVSLCFVFLTPVRATLSAFAIGLTGPAAGAWMLFDYGVLLPMTMTIYVVVFLSLLLSLLLYQKERRQVLRHIRQFIQGRQTILKAMAAVAEIRDAETGAHIKRTQEYILVLAQYLAKTGAYPELTREYIEMIFQCAPLHDIGKVGIPDNILLKPGPLTKEEFEIMKEHTAIGKTIIENSCKNEENKALFQLAAELAYTHHERWDGKGYPQGLFQTDIPISGRLMALADVYDALVSRRHYKDGFSHETAKKIILDGRGTQFDPNIVDAFLELEDQFLEISRKFHDTKK